jgi:hypothetical protein
MHPFRKSLAPILMLRIFKASEGFHDYDVYIFLYFIFHYIGDSTLFICIFIDTTYLPMHPYVPGKFLHHIVYYISMHPFKMVN